MKPLKIHIKYDAQDGYLYGGRLFLVCNDGAIKSASLWKIISRNIDFENEEYNLFKLAFDRNNWLLNTQAESFLRIEGIANQFQHTWNKYADVEYNFAINEEDLTVLDKVDSMPVFDFRLYGMRMFLGNRTGLYDAGISLEGNSKVTLPQRLERVFDSRTTGISAKSGSIMVSSNSDGLFHGTMHQLGERVQVRPKSVKPLSLRTGWTGYDVINYENQRDFDYLKNSYTREKARTYWYSPEDEDSKKIRIETIAEETIPMEDLFSNIDLNSSNIIYSFNSSTSCFFFLKDGRFINIYLNKQQYGGVKSIKLRSTLHELPNNKVNNNIEKPISSHIVPNGCVIEFFDKVVLIQDNEKIILNDSGVTSIKTYPSSIRYRNLVCLFDGEGVYIHSIFPAGA